MLTQVSFRGVISVQSLRGLWQSSMNPAAPSTSTTCLSSRPNQSCRPTSRTPSSPSSPPSFPIYSLSSLPLFWEIPLFMGSLHSRSRTLERESLSRRRVEGMDKCTALVLGRSASSSKVLPSLFLPGVSLFSPFPFVPNKPSLTKSPHSKKSGREIPRLDRHATTPGRDPRNVHTLVHPAKFPESDLRLRGTHGGRRGVAYGPKTLHFETVGLLVVCVRDRFGAESLGGADGEFEVL